MRTSILVLALLAVSTLVSVPDAAFAQRRVPTIGQAAAEYDRGYRDGRQDGERDARAGRPFDFDRDRRLSRRPGEFQRGYADGYRSGYDQFRGRGARVDRYRGHAYGNLRGRRSVSQDPAFARGYADGYERGQDDGRDRDRYDPVRHRDYRAADDGYFREYGPKQAYENNYRDGFRQGYEEGYREGNRRL